MISLCYITEPYDFALVYLFRTIQSPLDVFMYNHTLRDGVCAAPLFMVVQSQHSVIQSAEQNTITGVARLYSNLPAHNPRREACCSCHSLIFLLTFTGTDLTSQVVSQSYCFSSVENPHLDYYRLFLLLACYRSIVGLT